MVLMQQATPIETDPRRYLTLIHGSAGVGKTSFGVQISGHYFMITEAGTEGVVAFGDPILSWDDFLSKCNEIVQAKKDGFKDQREITTIVVDTVERLFWLGGAQVCKTRTFPEKGVKMRFEHIEDVPYGKGYKATAELLVAAFEKLLLLGFGVLLISHTKERIVKWRGQDFTSIGPNLPPSAAQALVDACGAVAHFDIDEVVKKDEGGNVVSVEEGRRMWWQPTFLRTAKHRLKGFPECLELPMDKGYETYLEAFQRTVKGLHDMNKS